MDSVPPPPFLRPGLGLLHHHHHHGLLPVGNGLEGAGCGDSGSESNLRQALVFPPHLSQLLGEGVAVLGNLTEQELGLGHIHSSAELGSVVALDLGQH